MSTQTSPTPVRQPIPPHDQPPSVIVVGLDDSPSGRRALAWAAAEASRRGATLQVITAWHWEATEGAPLIPVDPAMLRSSAEATQRAALAEVLATVDPPPVVACEVVETAAAQALVEASRHAELVVVGTHGRGPVRSLLLGSVSHAVIKHAACPVVVMPPPHTEPEPHRELATTV
jgi:nucleotide-binding universal stress UspA family protein